jgi:hypothetical protein
VEGAEHGNERIKLYPHGHRNRQHDGAEHHVSRTCLTVERSPDGDSKKAELQIMVVDRSRQEAEMPQQDEQADDEGENQQLSVTDVSDSQQQATQQDQHTDRRPDRDGPGQRHILWQEQVEQACQHNDRNVRYTRPVHQCSTVRTQAVLMQIEPALPREQVTHLHQSHDIVPVRPGLSKAAPQQTHHNDAQENHPGQQACPQLRCAEFSA